MRTFGSMKQPPGNTGKSPVFPVKSKEAVPKTEVLERLYGKNTFYERRQRPGQSPRIFKPNDSYFAESPEDAFVLRAGYRYDDKRL
jgi:hypothetical protein